MHSVALLKDRVAVLEEANHTLSKRRRARKIRVRQGGSLTVQDGQDLLDQKDVDQQVQQETREGSGRARRVEMRNGAVEYVVSLDIMRALVKKM
jgi:hypothetical protein